MTTTTATPEPGPALLHLDQVSRRWGAVTALHPLTLTITAGARHAVIGPNGAGKSTLLHLIAGTLQPTAGTIALDGRPITRHTPSRRARAGISRTFQHPGIAAGLSVADNLSLAIRPTRALTGRVGEWRQQLAAVLEQFDLAPDRHTAAGRLPYGRRRLLEIAMALAARPRLLLLDEPSAGLGPAEIEHLTTLIHELPADVAVVLVDHHLPLVWQAASTVTVLAAGDHLTTAPTPVVRADPAVHTLYTATPPAPRQNGQRRGPRARAALQVTGLTAGYGDAAPVLDQIILRVDAGTVHAVIGPIGAGKSTLINTLAGLHPARPGSRLLLHGQPLHTGTDGVRVAVVPQGRRLWPGLTVREHFALAAAARTDSRPGGAGGGRWSVDTVLELLPALRGKEGRLPGQMSGGEQQMLALARALLQQPELLLLDEPGEGLAPQLVHQLATIVRRIAGTGIPVVVADQTQQLAGMAADRVSVLNHGRIALTTTPTQLHRPNMQQQLAELLGITTGAVS